MIPSKITHILTITECQSLGWTFSCHRQAISEIYFSDGLILHGRDALHFMYENNDIQEISEREQEQEIQ